MDAIWETNSDNHTKSPSTTAKLQANRDKGRRRPKEAKTATKPARQKARADKWKQSERQRKHAHQSSETTEGRQKADTATHAAVVAAVG